MQAKTNLRRQWEQFPTFLETSILSSVNKIDLHTLLLSKTIKLVLSNTVYLSLINKGYEILQDRI